MARGRMASHKKGAIEQNAILVFEDESGFSLRPSVHRTWAPRGQTPVMKHKSNWKRLSAIGAITCEAGASGRELLLRFEDRPVNEDIVVSFVEGLKAHLGRRVVLLWDGLPSHRSTKTQEYIASQSDWLTVERFPAYAPELNPMEYLWSSAKSKGVGNLCPDPDSRGCSNWRLSVRKWPNRPTCYTAF